MATASLVVAMTMGVVLVACWAARVPGTPWVTREMAPKMRSIAFIAVTDNEGSALIFKAVQERARPPLQGAKPSELPFEQAATFRLVLNLKAANALGVKVPQSARVRVDEVIR